VAAAPKRGRTTDRTDAGWRCPATAQPLEAGLLPPASTARATEQPASNLTSTCGHRCAGRHRPMLAHGFADSYLSGAASPVLALASSTRSLAPAN